MIFICVALSVTKDLEANMSGFINNIKVLRQAAGLTQEGLAEMVGTNKMKISRLESGKTPLDINDANAIAPHLNVEAHMLFNAELAIDNKLAGLSDSGKSTYDGIMPSRPSEEVDIPIYDATVSCGGGSIIADESQVIGTQPYRKEELRCITSAKIEELFVLEARGESMEPFLFSGDKILIDTTQKTIISGKYYAISRDEGLTVKQIKSTSSGYIVASLNQNTDKDGNYIHKNIPLDDSMTIFGKVINRSGSV